jgi:ubiquitin-conjugating enzyme E2 S
MTSIHARIPASLRQAVDAARRRGEEPQSIVVSGTHDTQTMRGQTAGEKSISMRRKLPSDISKPMPLPLPLPLLSGAESAASGAHELSDDDEEHDPAKENDPSQSPSPVIQSPLSPRKNVLGKRPLSELPTPTDSEDGMTQSEKNIAANQAPYATFGIPAEPAKKSPKLAVSLTGSYAPGRPHEALREEQGSGCNYGLALAASAEEEKENAGQGVEATHSEIVRTIGKAAPSLRKVSNINTSKNKAQPRVGIRRL